MAHHWLIGGESEWRWTVVIDGWLMLNQDSSRWSIVATNGSCYDLLRTRNRRRPCKAIVRFVSSCWRYLRSGPTTCPRYSTCHVLSGTKNDGTTERRMARCRGVARVFTNRTGQFHQVVQPIQLQKCCQLRENHRIELFVHQAVYLEWFYLAVPDNILSSEKSITTHRFIDQSAQGQFQRSHLQLLCYEPRLDFSCCAEGCDMTITQEPMLRSTIY